DLDELGEVRCSVRLVLPREVQSLRLEPVAPGASAVAGDFRITLREMDAGPAKAPGQPGNATGPQGFAFRLEPLQGRRLCWLASHATEAPGTGWAFPTPSGDFFVWGAGVPNSFSFKV